ncbi:MAG: hypothetical protein ACLQLC_18970 [Candidatus Sulfotelmatobacter sp.]
MRYRIPSSNYAIDYEALFSEAQAENPADLVSFFRNRLPLIWRDLYIAAAGHQTNLVRFPFRSFQYICDLYSDLEAMGEVPYDQTIEDRVVGVFGTSSSAPETRGSGRIRGWGEPPEELVGSERDKGHFMAHCIGGGLDVNVFSQDRRLNRGWSSQGKLYRQMENYCYRQPGTFCFSRPIYADGSCVPRWLEFGLLKTDQTLWVEVFEN